MVCRLGLFSFRSFCLLLSVLSTHLCVFLFFFCALWLSSLVLSFHLCLYLLLVAGERMWRHLCFRVVPQPASRSWNVACVKPMERVNKFVRACVNECIVFNLAWLIRMPLAGSCPNRGCHLIKSIICWLNLLELRRKRSVHTLSRPICVSVPHSPTLLYI